jgi:HD-GYP domain-containing protein (c-di-GMP phosphodiesterase class II)
MRDAARPGVAPADSPALTPQDREAALALVQRLHGVIRSLKLYDPGHPALRTQLDELLRVSRAMNVEEVSILGVGGYCYVNGVRLRPEASHLATLRAVLEEFEVRRLGGLRFSRSLEAETLQAFLRVFHAERSEHAPDAIEAAIDRADLRGVAIIHARASGALSDADADAAAVDDERRFTRLVFDRAVAGTREMFARTARTGALALLQARRVVQPIVDQLLRQRTSLVGMTAMKRHDAYTLAHCVNVSILSVRMGQFLGLSRGELATIGTAGLLHDAGKIKLDPDLLRKPGALDDAEWAALQRHPLDGLRVIGRMNTTSELMWDAMRVAFEHHMHADHSGYPRLATPRELGSFSRIVSIADRFDAATAHRSYLARPFTAHEALRMSVGDDDARSDRAARWALVQALGIYPPGTLLRTAAGRLLLSLTPNTGDLRRPICRRLEVGDDSIARASAETPDTPITPDDHVIAVIAPEELDADVEGLLAA